MTSSTMQQTAASRTAPPIQAKCLLASPVGRGGEPQIRKIIERFGHDSFDFLLMVYDDSRYDDPSFAGCTIVRDKSPLFWQVKRHLTPALCRRYEYVFLWMDDLDVLDFDPRNFLQILRTHRIEVAQPALSHDSIISHRITGRQDYPVGRYTDFVEEMAMTFRGDLWERFWRLIRTDANPWGWGYDEFAYACCGFRRMAIIDAEVIRHIRAGSYHENAKASLQEMRSLWRRFHFSRKKALCPISGSHWQKYVAIPWRLLWHRLMVNLYALPPAYAFRRLLRKRLPQPPVQPAGATRPD